MGLDLQYRNIGSMNVLHKTRNSRKDLRHSSPSVDGSDDVCKTPSLTVEESDSADLLTTGLQYLDIPTTKKSKTILPKRSLVMTSSEPMGNDCGSKYSNDTYLSGNSFLWNSMINNLNYEKTGWSESNWGCNDWNGVGSDLTTNSGTVNSLNEEKNSDIFQNNNSSNDNFTNSSNSSKSNLNENTVNRNGNYIASKSHSSEGTKNDSTAETTPETLVTNAFQSLNLTSLNGYQFPSLLKSFKNVNSFLNNHPPLYRTFHNDEKGHKDKDSKDKTDSSFKDSQKDHKEKDYKGGRNRRDTKEGKDISFERDFDLGSITQSNGPPVTMKVYTSWNGDGENTTSVKKSEKVQLVARSGNWIYVRVNSNPNRYGWIPEFTLVESEMLSRRMLSS